MAVKHTGNTQFHSRSNSIGSSKWQFTRPPLVPRAYILNMSFMPHLPHKWYAIGLVFTGGKYYLRAYGAGSDADCSLDDVDIQAVLAAGPIFNIEMPGVTEAVALERMERGVSNVMHNLLEPTAAVLGLWTKIATTDGHNIYG